MDELDDNDLEHFRKRLHLRLEELRQVSEIGKDAAGAVELDQSRVGRLSRMDAMQAQAMSIETNRRRDVERHRIDAALLRMKRGEYGYCTECDEPVARGRLEAEPSVALCLQCAARAERV
ncbi:MAG: TraR/DksA family transcriptional regulator [Gammaproteobacteria bacterium]|nr:TraR/DksA family transcriptional regulator [Gammaproteobacteria bacterium]